MHIKVDAFANMLSELHNLKLILSRKKVKEKK